MENCERMTVRLRAAYTAGRAVLALLPSLAEAALQRDAREVVVSARQRFLQSNGLMERVFATLGQEPRVASSVQDNADLADARRLIAGSRRVPARDRAILACLQALAARQVARLGAVASEADVIGRTEAACALREAAALHAKTGALPPPRAGAARAA